MSNSLPYEPSKVQRRNKWINVLMVLIVLVIILTVLASVSLMTGFGGHWDGMFPAGEYHLTLQNEDGQPVQGATLNVFADRTRDYSFKYPIDNYFSAGDLISDKNGTIVALHKPRGIEFGGGCLALFWVFPICSSSPEFNFQISADGYKTFEFSTDGLFEPAYNNQSNVSTPVLLENGKEVEIPVYELQFVLEKK